MGFFLTSLQGAFILAVLLISWVTRAIFRRCIARSSGVKPSYSMNETDCDFRGSITISHAKILAII